MKLFFISDIHGSLYYLNKALQNFTKEQADMLVILGDELYHGPRNPLPLEYNPKGVAELLNMVSDKIIAVRGNCDSEVDEMLLDFPIMAPYSIILYNNRRLFLTHGHLYNETKLPKLSKGDVFLYGHTHIPKAEKYEEIYIINPGSVTLPKENNPNTFGVLANNLFKIKDLNGEVFNEIHIL